MSSSESLCYSRTVGPRFVAAHLESNRCDRALKQKFPKKLIIRKIRCLVITFVGVSSKHGTIAAKGTNNSRSLEDDVTTCWAYPTIESYYSSLTIVEARLCDVRLKMQRAAINIALSSYVDCGVAGGRFELTAVDAWRRADRASIAISQDDFHMARDVYSFVRRSSPKHNRE